MVRGESILYRSYDLFTSYGKNDYNHNNVGISEDYSKIVQDQKKSMKKLVDFYFGTTNSSWYQIE